MDETDKALQGILDSTWKADVFRVVTEGGTEVCDLYAALGYSDAEQKLAERIANDHNALKDCQSRLEALERAGRALIADGPAYDVTMFCCGEWYDRPHREGCHWAALEAELATSTNGDRGGEAKDGK